MPVAPEVIPEIPSEVVMEYKDCPLGCEPDDEIILTGFDRLHHLPGRFTVVKCRHCGLMRTNPRPTLETMSFYYPEDYGPFLSTKLDNADETYSSEKTPTLKRIVKRLVRLNNQTVPDLPAGNMLEIGCASGSFLHRMASLSWSVEGLEPNSAAAYSARELGFSVYTGTLESAPERSSVYDLVVGWMVLEHLHEPVLSLQKLASWTRKDGRLVFSVPNAQSWEFRVFGNAWFALQLPTHLYYYTPETIRAVLLEGGWKLERILHQRSVTNLMASFGYKAEDAGLDNRISHWLTNFPETNWKVQRWAYPLAYLLSLAGQTGRMTIWARKISS